MSHPVHETGDPSVGLWLPLIEYSVRSGVSLSTIRRKIKTNSIPYRLEKGKYLILFSEGTAPTVTAPAKAVMPPMNWDGLKAEKPAPTPVEVKKPIFSSPEVNENLSSDNLRMVTDAFEHALKEKEARIRLLESRNRELEERLSELKLLLQVIEEKYHITY